MNDLDKTTRRMSGFSSVDDIIEWLHYHDIFHPRKDIEAMWDARQYRIGHPDQYKHDTDYEFQVRAIGSLRKNNQLIVRRKVKDLETGKYVEESK